MGRLALRLLYWSPRVLSIAFAFFLSLFALDIFREAMGWWPMAVALLVHLIPTAILAGVLVLAWRWEWTGAAIYTLAAVLYGTRVLPQHPSWFFSIAAPLLGIATLFLLNWINRSKMRAAL